MDKLQKSWAQLPLTEAEHEVLEDEEGLAEERIQHVFYLVGRLLSIRPFNS